MLNATSETINFGRGWGKSICIPRSDIETPAPPDSSDDENSVGEDAARPVSARLQTLKEQVQTRLSGLRSKPTSDRVAVSDTFNRRATEDVEARDCLPNARAEGFHLKIHTDGDHDSAAIAVQSHIVQDLERSQEPDAIDNSQVDAGSSSPLKRNSELRDAVTDTKGSLALFNAGPESFRCEHSSLQSRPAAGALKAELASTLANMGALKTELANLSESLFSSMQPSRVTSPSVDVSPPISTFTAAAALLKVAELEGDVRAARLEGQLKEQRWAAAVSAAQIGAVLRADGVKQLVLQAPRTNERGNDEYGPFPVSLRSRRQGNYDLEVREAFSVHERPT